MSTTTPSGTSMEQRISGYWRELLGVEDVKRETHFFDVGGNSMLATMLANRIEDELGVRPTLEELFNTLEQVALACEALAQEAGRPLASPLTCMLD